VAKAYDTKHVAKHEFLIFVVISVDIYNNVLTKNLIYACLACKAEHDDTFLNFFQCSIESCHPNV